MYVQSVKYFTGQVNLQKHYHDFHQILFVKSGKISVTIDKEEEILSSGSLLILSRFEEHSIKVISDEYTRYMMLISPETSSKDKDDYYLTSVLVNRSKGFRHSIDTGDKCTIFEKVFSDMLDEYTSKDVLYDNQMNLLFHSFLIYLYRLSPEIFSDDPKANIGIVRAIQERFENNYADTFSLTSLASEYHISVSHLAHMFKNVTGYAPIDYLTVCRLNVAKKHLATTSMPIREIIDICGFGDESNFSRLFKIKIGMTPSEYRKSNYKS